jgi:hypothetical protein
MPYRRPEHTNRQTLALVRLPPQPRVPPLLSCHRGSKPVARPRPQQGRRCNGLQCLDLREHRFQGPNQRRHGVAIVSSAERTGLIRGVLPTPPEDIPSDTDCGDDLARRGDTDIELGLRLDSRGDGRRPHLHRAIAAWPRQRAGAAACRRRAPRSADGHPLPWAGGDHDISLVPCRFLRWRARARVRGIQLIFRTLGPSHLNRPRIVSWPA